jgi:hypothetical protein
MPAACYHHSAHLFRASLCREARFSISEVRTMSTCISDFGHVLYLLEAKGWYLYKGIPHAGMQEVIPAGKAVSLNPET